MANVRVKFEDGDDFLRELDRATGPALLDMANVVSQKVKDNLGQRGATHSTIRKGRRAIARSERRGFSRLSDRTNIVAAREEDRFGKVDPPGGFPRTRSGDLRRDVHAYPTRNGEQARVGIGKKYAAIHEFGGTISHPGGTPYIVLDEGPVFISKDKAQELKAKGMWVGYTKPHSIRIPKRPYFRPALKKTRQKQLAAFVQTLQQRMGLTGGDS